MSAYDSRAIANLMLDEADRYGFAITNLALQKLLYFAHGLYLVERKQPLVAGYFEAWEFGPVHPGAYRAFKKAEDKPIAFRARRQDLTTGVLSDIPPPEDTAVHLHLNRIITQYGRLTPGRLVEISHAKGAPWHFAMNRSDVSLGVRITNDVIFERFKHHKIPVGATPRNGEPGEDTPPS